MRAFNYTEKTELTEKINEWTSQIINIPILDGVLLENIPLTVNSRQVQHKLGRRIRGWIIIKQNADAVIYDDSANYDNKTFIKLKATANVTVSLWVF